MLGVQGASAEEFHSRCTANAHVLHRRARELADARDVVPAVLTAWAADVAVIEAVLWERIITASSTPLRDFFGAAEALSASSSSHVEPMDEADARAGDIIRALRAGARMGLPSDVAASLSEAWPDVAFLDGLPAPRNADVEVYVASRLGGRTPQGYVTGQRDQARALMDEAQRARVRGDVERAIELAFDADILSLDAYLVESAEAVGDVAQGTVVSRFTLVSTAIADIPGLPGDFAAAVAVLRKAMTQALGAADGDRLKQVLEPI